MSVRITQDEWLDALRRLGEKADGGLTTSEWAEKVGVSDKTMRVYLGKALRLGWVRRGEKLIEALNGRRTPVACYTVVQPGKSPGKKGGK